VRFAARASEHPKDFHERTVTGPRKDSGMWTVTLPLAECALNLTAGRAVSEACCINRD
jgi:hypothetical protein